MRIVILICLLFFGILFAREQRLSPLPLPTMEMVNTNPIECDIVCLSELLQEGQIFSFLARFGQNIKDNRLLSTFSTLMEQHGFGLAYANQNSDAQVKIALILPKKSIGSYSLSTINTVLAYLTSQPYSFFFEVFDIGEEDLQGLSTVLGTIENRGFGGAIAICTTKAIPFIPQLTPKIPLFIASVHKEQVIPNNSLSSNLLFGGISYHEQIATLKRFMEPSARAVLFNDESATGLRIANEIKQEHIPVALEESLNSKTISTFGRNLKYQANILRGSNLFLNTPINNSAFILSQLTYNRIQPATILTTQLGFNHALFTLTQQNDRLFLFVSSVTGRKIGDIREYAALLDVDLYYDWIHYSTAIGAEYLYHQLFSDSKKWFSEKFRENQVKYEVKVYRARNHQFEVVE
ncbi:MAG: hypothetical protein K2O85_08675 [Helicobacter sp.]|nr:hypothetical protein [Helicobacter sp.]